MRSARWIVFSASTLLLTSCAANNAKKSSQPFQTDSEATKPSRVEYNLAANNKLAELWQGRCALGDPVGCVGFAAWGSPKALRKMHGLMYGTYWTGLGKVVRYNARKGLLRGNPELYSSADELVAANLSLAKSIVRAHLGKTSVDSNGTKYFLSAREITDYHHAVFDQYNISRKWYGGSILTGRHHRLLEPLYCRPFCDNR